MPNSTFVKGTPILNAIKGFDREEEVVVFYGKDGFIFIGYSYQIIALNRFGVIKPLKELIKTLK